MDYQFGPRLEQNGVTFRLWAPSLEKVEIELEARASLPMQKRHDGFWEGFVRGAGAGVRYRFRIGEKTFPDIASREQERDSDGWSVVRGSFGRAPMDGPLSPWHQAVICEVHVGTATPEGTFAGLSKRLEHFRDAGYTTLELMPIADFPGQRNWGYDGTLIFAPDKAYGKPEELRALVDQAHDLGLCVVLDVVYNHFGSVHNFLPEYCPEWFDESLETPWGAGIDFRRPQVRQFYYENAVWWLTEFDLDGLRFDAVHEVKTEARDRFLGELARACRTAKPGCKLIVENVENHAHWLTRDERGDPVDYSAQWNDDYHHVINFLITGEQKSGYDDKSRDPIADFEKSLADGFVHDGDTDGKSDGRTRGEPGSQLPMEAFVQFIQNHDWIGNRPDALRLGSRIDPDRNAFAKFVTVLNPQVPLFFMGEEASLLCPFPFFFDLPEPAASEKRDDRYKQMREIFNEEIAKGDLPDPQDETTFRSAKIVWPDFERPEHREAFDYFRQLTALRRELIWPLSATKCLNAWSARQGNGIVCTWQYEAGTLNLALNPTGDEIAMSFRWLDPSSTVGTLRRDGDRVVLGAWSAVVWRS